MRRTCCRRTERRDRYESGALDDCAGAHRVHVRTAAVYERSAVEGLHSGRVRVRKKLVLRVGAVSIPVQRKAVLLVTVTDPKTYVCATLIAARLHGKREHQCRPTTSRSIRPVAV